MALIDRLDPISKRALAVATALAFLPPLLTRLVIGIAFYQTGAGKLQNPEGVAAFFGSLGIPFPELNAAFVSRLEYYGGALLVVGLLTRLAALGLASTMTVALMTADRESFLAALRGSADTGLTDVAPVVFGLFLLWLLIHGPGVVSADAAVGRWLAKGSAPDEDGGAAAT